MSRGISVQANKCDPETLDSRRKIVDRLEETTKGQIQWYECDSASEYRHMRRNGTNGFPKPVLNPNAKDIHIPSSQSTHSIQLRRIDPQNGSPKGVFLHFHAGGFVIGSAASHDTMLTKFATETSLAVVSVEYRMAPEFEAPAMGEDCLDAALFALSEEGQKKLGGSLMVMGGESAGGYLTVWTAMKLREQGIDVCKRIKALAPTCGMFDLNYTPSVLSHERRVIMGKIDLLKFIDTAFPRSKFDFEERQKGEISPLYADLHDLPPAIFTVGTVDPLLDDSVFMAAKWALAGNIAKLVVVPEAVHGFTLFPMGEVTDEGVSEILDFINKCLPED